MLLEIRRCGAASGRMNLVIGSSGNRVIGSEDRRSEGLCRGIEGLAARKRIGPRAIQRAQSRKLSNPITRLPNYPMTKFKGFEGSGQFSPGFALAGRTIRERTGVQIHFDSHGQGLTEIAAAQVPPDQLL